jgi:hypothetical protein
MLFGKAKGMACSVGVVVDKREQHVRLRQHHLLVASETGAAAITVPVGGMAFYRPAVALPDVLSEGISAFRARARDEKRPVGLTSLFPPVSEGPVNCMHVFPRPRTCYQYP